MKLRLFTLLVLACASRISYADCSDVLKLSKLSTNTVQSKERIESTAKAFCNEYKRATATSKSATYGINYKFLAASMGNQNASELDVASKVCSQDDSKSAAADAYSQYAETIPPEAYNAYKACEQFQSAQLKISLESQQKTESIFSINNGNGYAAPALLSFTATGDVTCLWEGAALSAKDISISPNTGLFLKCTRQDVRNKSSISIMEKSRASGAVLTIPWDRLDKDDMPVDQLSDLIQMVKNSNETLASVTKQLSGAVVAFSLPACPDGWAEHKEAYGRFIRGVDKSVGATIDPSGQRIINNTQEDAIKDHTHKIPSGKVYPRHNVSPQGPDSPWVAGLGDTPTLGVAEGGAIETRPKNIALLYCRKI